MRRLDALECAAGGFTPEAAIAQSKALSDVWYEVERGGDAIAVWGWRVDSFLLSTATCWLLTFEGVERHRRWFARESLAMVRELEGRFRTIQCEVWCGHAGAVRWLQWLGFEFEAVRYHGDKEPFYVMKRESRLWAS